MEAQIKEYAKRLKLSWLPKNYHQIQADTHEEYLLKLFEKEVENRHKRKVNLLLKQAALPKIPDKPFDWSHIQIPQGITKEYILEGEFIKNQENLIFYGGVGTGKTFLSTLVALNVIRKKTMKTKFFTVAGLVNVLLEANEKVHSEHFSKI